LGMEELIKFEEEALPEDVSNRRELFLKIKEELGDETHCYFVHEGREFRVESDDDIHFCKDWMSVGVEVGSKCLVCLTSNAVRFELGIRKALSNERVDQQYKVSVMEELKEGNPEYEYQNSGWWYVVKEMDDLPSIEFIVAEIKGIKEKLLENDKE